MATTLKRELNLDTRRAMAGIKQTEAGLRRVGTQATATGAQGEQAGTKMGSAMGQLSGMLGTITSMLGGAGLIGALGRLEAKWLASFAAMAKASNDAVAKMAATARMIADPAARETQDVTGLSLLEQERRGVKAQMEFDLSNKGEWKEAAKTMRPRIGEENWEKMMPLALKFARVSGSPAGVAGDVAALGWEQYDKRTPEEMKSYLAKLRRAATVSAMTSGGLAGIFTSIAKPLKDAGLKTFEEQAEWSVGLATFFPKDAALLATSLKQLATLPLRKNEYMSKLLEEQGYNKGSFKLQDLMGAIVKKVQSYEGKGFDAEAAGLQELAAGTGVPIRAFRPLQMAASKAAIEKKAEAKRAIAGATWREHIEAPFAEVTGTTMAGIRRREAANELLSLREVTPGSLRWSANMLENMRAGIRQGTPGYGELTRRKAREWNADWYTKFPVIGDATITPEQAGEMYELGEVSKEFEARILEGIGAGRLGFKEGHALIKRLQSARAYATEGGHVKGNAIDYLPALQTELEDIIQAAQQGGVTHIEVNNVKYSLTEKNTQQTREDRTNQGNK